MKVRLTFVMVSVLAAILLVESGVTDALMAFVLVGAIPGTLYSLSPSTMLLILGILAITITLRSTVMPFVRFLRIDHIARKHVERKERLPKRRFGQI